MKKIALFMAAALLMGGFSCAQALEIQETIDEAAVAKAKEIYAQVEKLKAMPHPNKRKINELLIKAADMETNAHKLGNKCKHGSHVSIETVKKNHRHCEECHEVEIKDGACARVPGTHKHHYCYCDC